ncbi:hypothetical protein BDV19DRAFT_385301 [Aspergillus venezuelensis]
MTQPFDRCNEIRYLTAFISLFFFKRRPVLVEPQGVQGDESSYLHRDDQLNDIDDDETEFEDEDDSDITNYNQSLLLLKMKALDRLAEALARFKIGPHNDHREEKKSKGKPKENLDAKHVTGVVMVEDTDSVTIVCAKNEGLDEVDKVFLHRLSIGDDDVWTLFEEIFRHNENRVGYYSKIVRHEFSQVSKGSPSSNASNNMRHGVSTSEQHSEAPKEWQGLEIEQKPKNHSRDGHETVDDCLSNAEDENSIEAVFKQLECLFGRPKKGDNNSAGMKAFLKGFHNIMKHHKQRPAMKDRIRRKLSYNARSSSRVWDALLFLGRTLHASVVLAEFASKVNAFANIRFVHAAKYPKATEKTKIILKLPMDVLKKFRMVPSDSVWIRYLQSRDAIDTYERIFHMKPTVHAETQLIYLSRKEIPIRGTRLVVIFSLTSDAARSAASSATYYAASMGNSRPAEPMKRCFHIGIYQSCLQNMPVAYLIRSRTRWENSETLSQF